ncbi:MAG: hypothetical protein IPM43_10905 [Actinomycetota bacterium]|nr:MAG: hypothetical protein IPM43_10905 [Actinomycetota bacterium]
MTSRWASADERRHPDAPVEEWTFAFWTPDGTLGGLSGHRLLGRRAWYFAALARAGEPLLHVTEWDVTVRADPMIVKAEALWAEHTCDAAFEQWCVGNEAYAAALDSADDALDRAYGVPTAMAFDLEWYASAEPEAIEHGYRQDGVVHGTIELAGQPHVELAEVPAERSHRWGDALGPLPVEPAVAHLGLRAAFAFPDGTLADWVLTPSGWHARGAPLGSKLLLR